MSPKLSYDIWLHWTVTHICNLQCSYCCFKPESNSHDPVKAIDLQSLINTLDATRKTFKIGYTGGGEPFLVPNIVDVCKELTKKHYIRFNTNLTPDNVIRFAEEINPSRVEHIHASLHIEELRKKRLENNFVEHYLLLQNKGFNISAIAVAHPKYTIKAESFRKEFSEKGIAISFGLYNGNYHGKEFPAAYTDGELAAFRIQRESITPHYQKYKVCNAGYNVMVVNPDGSIGPCNMLNTDLGNIYNTIKTNPSLMVCPYKRCGCPLYSYDTYLFDKAIKENSGIINQANFWWIQKKHSMKYDILTKIKQIFRPFVPRTFLDIYHRLVSR